MSLLRLAGLAVLGSSLVACSGTIGEAGGGSGGANGIIVSTGGISAESGGSSSGGASIGATGGLGSGGVAATGGISATGGTTATGGNTAVDPCESLTCENGSCAAAGDTAHCACDLGWTGDSCDVPVNNGCEDAPCQNGTCSDEGSGSYSCACAAGFTGANCDVDIDDCAVNPCENGTCTDAVDAFSCSCEAGWQGTTCSDNIDDCAENPCENGTCTDDINAFACECEKGWAGATCQTEVSSCADAPCAHGSCTDTSPGAYTCSCDAGWTGENCSSCATDYTLEGGACISEKQVACRNVAPTNANSVAAQVSISYTSAGGWTQAAACAFTCKTGWTGTSCNVSENDCAGHACENGGTCIDGHQSYSCDCPSGFAGDFCQTNVDDCSADPCEHGSCQDGVGTYSCQCDTGWAGANCNSCSSDYTQEGGQCINEKQVACRDIAPTNASSTPGSVTISYSSSTGWSQAAACSFSCNAGWQGADCSQSQNDCGGHACQNGASCVDGHQSYSCDCTTGYSGQYCATNIDDCQGDPCNGSTCIDGVNSYSCSCNTGYTGSDCSGCATNYIDEGAGCINQKGATCTDSAPTNATAALSSVVITYTTSGGWSTPADCDFSCNPGWSGDDCSEGSGDSGLIDSFESCDDQIEITDGRIGTWFFYKGTGVGGWMSGASDPSWGAGCGAWMEGGRVSNTNLYAGMGFGLNSNGPTYDASAYDNIEVQYSSDQPVTFYAKWDDTGVDAPRSSIELPATVGVSTVAIPLSNFAGISTTTLTEFQFEPTDIPSGFGVAVYEVRFTGGSVSQCSEGATRCADSGQVETCNSGAWQGSDCSSGEVCSGGGCVDDDATPVQVHGHLSVENDRLVNESGGLVQLKGVSTHWLNFADADDYETNATALVWMRDNWGLSVIRAAMGVEESGGYLTSDANKNAMLADIDAIVSNAVAAGVYVIIDWHTHYTQTSGAGQFFEDMVGLYGHLPNVLYETYNEPLNVSWTGTLKPYHEAVLSRIRAKESSRGLSNPAVVLLGTPNWDQDVDDVIGNEVAGDNLMYVSHFYSCTHGSTELNKAKSALSAGVPLFITEWGATEADGGIGGTSTCTGVADDWHDWMDANSLSWAAWKLDDCDWEISSRGVADTSCLLKQGASASGGWTDSDLNGHGSYVRSKMQN